MKNLNIRWIIGDVSSYGFQALKLSLMGAYKSFGNEVSYTISYNNLEKDYLIKLIEDLNFKIRLHEGTNAFNKSLINFIDKNKVNGVAYKFSPVRLYKREYELILDNDVIFWKKPEAIIAWPKVENKNKCIISEDTKICFGQFINYCPLKAYNTGVRGFPPDYDFEAEMIEFLNKANCKLNTECDEQGLQVALMFKQKAPLIVTLNEVTICSPFPEHKNYLGTAGVHFS